MKSAKTLKALILSAVSMMICIAMLLGTTFALFTKTVTSQGNVITTGAFNVAIEYCGTYDGTYQTLTTTKIFDANALLPGQDTGVKYIKVTNNNAYAVTAVVTIKNKDENYTSSLLDIHYGDVSAETACDSLAHSEAFKTNVSDAIYSGTIAANGSVIIAVAFKLPADVENGETSITNTFDIEVVATQANS